MHYYEMSASLGKMTREDIASNFFFLSKRKTELFIAVALVTGMETECQR